MIFIVVESVAYVDGALKGYCLMKKAVDARRVDVGSVIRREWRRKGRSMCGGNSGHM